MDLSHRIERSLSNALALKCSSEMPPGLRRAVRDAVFPGGARIRPRLCLAVALANGDPAPATADAAATAVELLHCASLVHDDMPCFDDADTRRGKPTVHRAHGDALALLCGDSLIERAFETLATGASDHPAALAPLVVELSRAAGMVSGLCAGQAWECEPNVELTRYHRAKTGALFVASAVAGAVAAGVRPEPWRLLGERLGEAYQVADDLRDVLSTPEELGKPVGRDVALDRPSVVRELGLPCAVRRLRGLIGEALEAIPCCPGDAALRAQIEEEASRLLPGQVGQRVA
jgi:geranylgeranyl diphosphate synthase type II